MYEYKGKIVRVVDGDTYDIEVDLGFGVKFKERFRLQGVNTPETYGVKKDSEEYKNGLKAKERVEELVSQHDFCMLSTTKDKKGKYGRYIAEIWFETSESKWFFLANALVQEGLAVEVEY